MIFVDKIVTNKYIYYNSQHQYGYELPDLSLLSMNDLILVQNEELGTYYREMGYPTQSLSAYLNLEDTLGLYEIYSYYFEGKLKADIDMLELIFKGLLNDSDYCFCVKLGVTFCWFKVTETRIEKLGLLQFGDVITKYTVGKFIKRLRFNIAKSGVNLNKIQFVCWNEEDITDAFKPYISKYICLEQFFNKIDGLKGLNSSNVIRLLSKDVKYKVNINAETLVDTLQQNFETLGIYEENGMLYSANAYLKDYSICVSSMIEPSKCTYGLIIDCEGKTGLNGDLKNGCRELGGLIYCKYKNILLNIETFSCDEMLIEDTLSRVFENYRNVTNQIKKINVLVYGYSDTIMLQSSIENLCSKKFIKTIYSRLNIIDCQSFLNTYIKEKGLDLQLNPKLNKLATELKVSTLNPKHIPLNDARTLFNILAKILQLTDSFVV